MKDPPGRVNKEKVVEKTSPVATVGDDTNNKEMKPTSAPEDTKLKPPTPESPPKKRRRMDSELSTTSIVASPQQASSVPDFPNPAKPGSEQGKSDCSDGKYALGSRLEARDLSTGKWYNVKVVEVDLDEREVLIHFEKWSQRFDEWIPMDSSRLREAPRKLPGKSTGGGYRVGETVMATWTDCRKYPAKVKTILGADKVEVLFFDGFSKTMKVAKISKFEGDLEVQPAKPPFGAATMTKAERRERNRKIVSVAELFHMKKSYKRRSKEATVKDATANAPPEANKSANLSETKIESDISLTEVEGEKLDSSSALDESTPAAAVKRGAGKPAAPADDKGKKRKRTYNRVFLDSSPAGTVREVYPGRGGRNGEGGPIDDLDNWEPDGDEAYVVESSDGLRRSIIVADDRLPAGWEKHTIQRRSGNSAGKWDVFLVSPTGRRFRSRKEMSAYFAETKGVYEPHLYDFTLRGLSHRTLKNRSKSTPAAQSPTESDVVKPASVVLATETPQRKVKTLLPKAGAVKAAAQADKLPVPDEGKVYVGQMQVEVDLDGGFICPKEGCLKHFRRENLLQMHIKHYHPEFNKFMGSTPNVADLAYARTVGEPIEDIVPSGRMLDSYHEPSTPANRKPAPPPAAAAAATPTQRREEAAAAQLDGRKVLKLGQAISILTDAVKVRDADATGSVAPPKLPTSSPLRDLLSEQARPPGIKTLLPVVRSTPSKSELDSAEDWRGGSSHRSKARKRRLSDAYMESLKRKKLAVKRTGEATTPEARTMSSDESPTFARPHKKLPLLAASLARPPLLPQQYAGATETAAQLAGGAVPAQEMTQEQLNKRDIINCTCGVMEEDGLMIQCDLCLCWQHGYCNAIENERQVPEKYVCAICLRPARARSSLRHRHDQAWLKEGTLPTTAALHSHESPDGAQRTQQLRKSHALTGELLGVKAVLRSLRAKVNIADKSDHPKLYLWAKPWSKDSLDEEEESKPLTEVRQEAAEVKESPAAEAGQSTNSAEPGGGSKLLLQALTAPAATPALDEKQLLELPICQSELLRFASSMADNLDQPGAPAAPVPEEPIDPAECRTSLLEHIEHDQRQLALSLQRLDKQIASLEADDPEPPPQESVDFCPRMKHTIKMLLRDLNTMRNIATL